jgi:hypothetical protein
MFRCLSLLPAIVASFAVMTSVVFGFYCQSVKFVSSTGTDDFEDLLAGPFYQFTKQYTTVAGRQVETFGCAALPDSMEADAKLKTVRAFTVIAGVLGGLITFGLWLAPCLAIWSDASWKCLAITIITILPLFQGLTFLILDSSFCTDNTALAGTGIQYGTCQWEQGLTSNVLSVVLWLITGLSMLGIPAPRRDPPGPPEIQVVEYVKNPATGLITETAETAVDVISPEQTYEQADAMITMMDDKKK